MKRSITTSRLFSLGDFKNISFTDTIECIPEDFAMDNEAVQLLRSIQLFQIEKAYLKYMNLSRTMGDMDLKARIELVDELDLASSKKFTEKFLDTPKEMEDPSEEG